MVRLGIFRSKENLMPKVLISDAMDDIAEKILLSNNIEVDVITNFTPDELNQKY